jgi:hypothetical protein
MKPTTIFRHAFGVYPSLAMLAGMQLDVFTPLKDGPMTEEALALNVQPRKLRPLLYALINAELLSLDSHSRQDHCSARFSRYGQTVQTRRPLPARWGAVRPASAVRRRSVGFEITPSSAAQP